MTITKPLQDTVDKIKIGGKVNPVLSIPHLKIIMANVDDFQLILDSKVADALLESGDNFVSSKNLYGGSLNQFKVTFKRLGLNVKWAEEDVPEEFSGTR